MIFKDVESKIYNLSKNTAIALTLGADFTISPKSDKELKELGIEEILHENYIDGKWVGKGYCYLIDSDNRKIANLITREKHFQKSTYSTIYWSFLTFRLQCLANNIKKFAIDKNDIGFQGLDWEKIKDTIREIFKEDDIEILICKD